MSDAPADLKVPDSALVNSGEVVAVINQKGGSGKTTTAVTLAAYLASQGVPVDLVDADKQDGSATEWLPPQWEEVPIRRRWDLSHVLLEETDYDSALWPTDVEGPLSILPSFESLEQFELKQAGGKDFLLQEAMENSKRRVGVTIIDAPPNLGQVTFTCLAAASAVIIPTRIGGLDMKGVAQLNKTVSRVRRLNPKQRTVALLVVDRQKSNLTDDVADQLAADYPEALQGSISHTVRVGEAPYAQEPLTTFAPSSNAMQDYKAVADALFAPVLQEWASE
ncbi:ParA family protein [Nocardiopsis baichengensis]|uniref:ParA family protein n=1 Tax=Nocardiopsis baichengensis TaxID=280240 RepID=UPI0003478DEC|nr:ParA family protein [Nocardiopsis baichengensis]